MLYNILNSLQKYFVLSPSLKLPWLQPPPCMEYLLSEISSDSSTANSSGISPLLSGIAFPSPHKSSFSTNPASSVFNEKMKESHERKNQVICDKIRALKDNLVIMPSA